MNASTAAPRMPADAPRFTSQWRPAWGLAKSTKVRFPAAVPLLPWVGMRAQNPSFSPPHAAFILPNAGDPGFCAPHRYPLGLPPGSTTRYCVDRRMHTLRADRSAVNHRKIRRLRKTPDISVRWRPGVAVTLSYGSRSRKRSLSDPFRGPINPPETPLQCGRWRFPKPSSPQRNRPQYRP